MTNDNNSITFYIKDLESIVNLGQISVQYDFYFNGSYNKKII